MIYHNIILGNVFLFAEEKYCREVLIIPVDFSEGLGIYPNLAEQLKDLDIGTLGSINVKVCVWHYIQWFFIGHMIVT